MSMRSTIAIGLILLSRIAVAEDSITSPAGADAAIDRGLAFLAKDSLKWKADHNCASCHHAATVVWSMREAKQRGRVVDEDLLVEMTKWMAESGEGKTSLERPADAPRALNTKALYYSLALGIDSQPDEASQAGLKQLLETVKADQNENGSWSSWPDTRPPIFGNSDESATALAMLALMPSAAGGDEASKVAISRSMKWLTETPSDDDPQSVALRLIVWKRLERPASECDPLVASIRERQNADGGWSQTMEMASDAWATGQALYALSTAGVRPDDASITRGQAFLIGTQQEDGSWPMTSRPAKPGAVGAKNLIPITCSGSCWAILGLVRSR